MRQSFRRHQIAAAALLTALAAQVQAQQREQEQPRAESVLSVEIVGTAPLAGLGIDRNMLPYAVQSASSKTLRQSQSDNLNDFMGRNLTGVNVNEISGSPFQNDITFRGFRISPVLGAAQGMSVYLDGVRVNEPFGDVVNWDMLPEGAISELLLVPGSNPLYGLNTLGGALALNTKSGIGHAGFDAGVAVSASGQRRTDLSYGVHDEDNWHALIAATLFDDAGWREHSSGRLGNLFVKLGHAQGPTQWNVALLGGRSRLTGNGLLPSYRQTDDGMQGGLYEENRRAAYTFPDETRNRLLQGTFNLTHSIDEHNELSATVYARNSRRDTVNGDLNDDYSDYVHACGKGYDGNGAAIDPASCSLSRAEGAALHSASLNTTGTRQNSHGASLHLSSEQGRHRLSAGASFDASRVSFAQYEQAANFTTARAVLADPDAERELDSSLAGSARAAGLYLSDTWTVAKGSYLTASARYNHARVSNTLDNGSGAQAPESFTYSKLNPALGLAREVGAGLTLFANVAQSNRVPTVIELGCADPAQPCRLPVGLQSDPYLKQVVARTVEAGARWHQGRSASFSASLYRTVNRDDILFLSAGTTQQGYFANFERTVHQGLDLSASKQFGAVSARLSYSYLDASYGADGTLFTGARNVGVTSGTRIAGLPRHTFKLGLDWQAAPAWSVGGELQAVSSMATQGNEDGLRADPVPGEALQYADWRIRGYALLNLRASYRPDARWEMFLRINNATNRRYESYGAVAADMFPDGRLLQPHEAAGEAHLARFVAPGASRSVLMGLRYHF